MANKRRRLTVPNVTILFAILLIVLGVGAYTWHQQHHAPASEPTTAPAVSEPTEGLQPRRSGTTALIPAYVGGVLLLLGVVGLSPSLRKHAMHLAAVIALLGTLAPLAPLIIRASEMSALAFSVNVAMLALCGVLTVLYVRSFILARKARTAA
jgi:hypothetical protein